MTKIALVGAAGKMGMRLASNLKKVPEFDVDHVEVSAAGRTRLREELGVECVDINTAVQGAEVVLLAVPDALIGKITQQLSPQLKAGTMVVALDAAAPHAGEMPDRPDLSYFITHPCHPPIFSDETDPEAQRDFFGGIAAKQHIICVLMQGPEEHYALGEKLARAIYAPVMRAHRVSLTDLAIMEPVLSETVEATCITVMREALDEAVARGVPKEAARDFMLGHMTILTAIMFEELPGVKVSDGAQMAIDAAKAQLFKPDWKKVFEPEAVLESVRAITNPPKA
jgi:hypothetical protein